jgi:hypothetical protein
VWEILDVQYFPSDAGFLVRDALGTWARAREICRKRQGLTEGDTDVDCIKMPLINASRKRLGVANCEITPCLSGVEVTVESEELPEPLRSHMAHVLREEWLEAIPEGKGPSEREIQEGRCVIHTLVRSNMKRKLGAGRLWMSYFIHCIS